MVDVEARVDVSCSRDNVVPDITSRYRRVGGGREWSSGREGQRILHERIVSTSFRAIIYVCHERVVEVEDSREVVQCSHGWCIDQGVVVVDGRVVDLHTLDVVVICVVSVQHSRRDVRVVLSSIRLASNVDLTTVEIKGIDKVLPETHKVTRDVDL